MIDDATFHDAKVAAKAYTMSVSCLLRYALKAFLSGNRPSIPIPNLERPTETGSKAPPDQYTEQQQAEFRRQNLAAWNAKVSTNKQQQQPRPNNWENRQAQARTNLNPQDTEWQRQMRDGVTDVTSFSNATRK